MSRANAADIADFIDTLQWENVPTRQEKIQLTEDGAIQSVTFLCPADLHRRFKIAVTGEGMKSMTNAFIAFMETYAASYEARRKHE